MVVDEFCEVGFVVGGEVYEFVFIGVDVEVVVVGECRI